MDGWISYFYAILPTKCERVIMIFSSVFGGLISWAYGGITDAILWLCAFVFVDYCTGLIAGWKTGRLCSKRGLVGAFKKVMIFVIVGLCHGLDIVLGLKFLQDASVICFTLNEAISIAENLDRMGLGDLIPAPIQKAVRQIKERQDNILEGATTNGKNKTN